MQDHVRRVEEWVERHPGATWESPHRKPGGQLFGKHVVTYRDPDGEVRQEGHHDLGKLCDYLEALDRAQMGPAGP